MFKYTREKLIKMGYTKVGEYHNIETWDNFHSTCDIKDDNTSGYIFQFNNLGLKEEPIGCVYLTKEMMEVIINGHKEEL
jgi:hypothetical protein